MLRRVRSLPFAIVAALVLAFSFASAGTPQPYPPIPIIGGKPVATTAPTNGQTLTYSSGTGKWAPATPTAGTVTSVSGTSPISVATGTTTPVISLGTVPIANGGTGSTTQNFVDLTTTQNVAGAKTFTTSPLTVAGTLASSAGASLTLRGGTTNATGINFAQGDGTVLADVGATVPGYFAIRAGTSIAALAGTGGLDLSAMTGDTNFTSGNATWAGSSTTNNGGTTGANGSFTTSNGGTLTFRATASTIDFDAATTRIAGDLTGLTTSALTTGTGLTTVNGNLAVASTKTVAVGGNVIVSNNKLQGGQLDTATVPAAALASNAVAAAAFDPTTLRYLGALGLAAAGAVTLTGAKVGDKVIGVVDNVGASVSADFESTITVNNQIQQTAGVLTAHALSVLLVAKGG